MAYHASVQALPEDGESYSNNCVNGRCSNCGECCADLLPLSRKELFRLKEYAEAHNLVEHRQAPFFDPKATDLTCPFRNEETRRCDVYEVRPYICRVFTCAKSLQVAREARDHVHASKKKNVYSLRNEVFGNPESMTLIRTAMKEAGLTEITLREIKRWLSTVNGIRTKSSR